MNKHKNSNASLIYCLLKYRQLCFVTLMLVPVAAYSTRGCDISDDTSIVKISDFSNGKLEGWRAIKFSGQTAYKLITLDDTTVLQASSNSSASGLVRKRRIDLQRTPILTWRWRVDKPLINNDEKEKHGDDFSARLYVIVDGGLLFWQTRALNYVWSYQLPENEVWPNPFAGDKAMMLSVRATVGSEEVWHIENRNVYRDLQQIFGQTLRYVDAVALMTDTDNTGGSALAYFGDICFSADYDDL